MKYLLLLFIPGIVFCQNKTSGIIIDDTTKTPINTVSIFNQIDRTTTNEDGYFVFTSNLDSLTISKLGYKEIKLTFGELNADTIFLSPKEIILLDEATIVNYPNLLRNVYLNVIKNYPHTSFVDKFFLRTILKRDNKIYRFEDTQGKIKRNSLFLSSDVKSLKFDFQILNQRKSGLLYKDRNIEDFDFHSLKELFDWVSTVFIDLKCFTFQYENIDENQVKVFFTPLPDFKNKNIGYYVIDKRDYSITEYFSKTNPDFQNEIRFIEKQGIRFRTINAELHIRFSKNNQTKKYCISDATLNQKTEVFGRNNEKIYYDVIYQLANVQNFNNENFKPNVKNSKRLFEINYDYDEQFWENQNQLLLTDELQSFIDSSQADSKEFKSISNLKKKK